MGKVQPLRWMTVSVSIDLGSCGETGGRRQPSRTSTTIISPFLDNIFPGQTLNWAEALCKSCVVNGGGVYDCDCVFTAFA